jgi:hypothetical protein
MGTGVRLCVWGPLGIALLAAGATAGEAQTGNDAAAVTVTPLEWLRSLPKPAFKEGHTLPPLMRWGWAMSFDVAKEPRWLITAWAADGIEGSANVEIPELGSVAVQARATGSAYEATMKDGKQSLVPAGGGTRP